MRSSEQRFMRRALRLASKGEGRTSPNPMVGAVIVKNGRIIGTGWHRKAGGPHAEVYALREAGGRAKNAVMYVTLEPCSTWGRTPPCAEAIINAGIKKAVVAARDPNPINHNKGIARLRKHGVEVVTGVMRKEAESLNKAYNKFIIKKMPFVTIKAAMTLDGKIASYTGNSRWISCPASRRLAYRLRRSVDAVLVGRRTFLNDKPRFKGVRYKIFLGRGRVNLRRLLLRLAGQGVMHLLIEGGGETIASALKEGLADRLFVFVAPKIIGGRDAPTLTDGEGTPAIKDAVKVKDMSVCRVGTDLLITGCLQA